MSSRIAFSLKPLWYIPNRAVGILIHPAGGYGRLAGQHDTASNGIDRSIRGISFPYDLLVVVSANFTTLLNLVLYPPFSFFYLLCYRVQQLTLN